MSTSIIIGIVIVASIILLFVMMSKNQQNKLHKKLLVIDQYAENQGCVISEKEALMSNFIGIDSNAKKLFFINSDKNIESTFDLANFKRCAMVERSRSASTNSGAQKVIEKIELSFSPISAAASTPILEIYNTENGDFSLNGELQFCEKWIDIINRNLK